MVRKEEGKKNAAAAVQASEDVVKGYHVGDLPVISSLHFR